MQRVTVYSCVRGFAGWQGRKESAVASMQLYISTLKLPHSSCEAVNFFIFQAFSTTKIDIFFIAVAAKKEAAARS